jgi:hypothetical protein
VQLRPEPHYCMVTVSELKHDTYHLMPNQCVALRASLLQVTCRSRDESGKVKIRMSNIICGMPLLGIKPHQGWHRKLAGRAFWPACGPQGTLARDDVVLSRKYPLVL